MVEKTGTIDPTSSASLAETRDMMILDPSIDEVYAKTPSAKFIVSKRLKGDEVGVSQKGETGEIHLVIGRKDANLTDAERKSHSTGISF